MKPKIHGRKKLKILLINRWVGYNYGGNESHMRELITWFVKKGHEVTVITTKGKALENYNEVKKHYVSVPEGYYSYGLLGVFYAILFLIKSFFKFTQIYFKGNRFDIQSIHFSLEAILARFIKLIYGIPYVFVIAGDTYLEMIEGRRADGVVHISRFMYKQGEKFKHSAKIIPKGIDLGRFNPGKYSEDLVMEYCESENQKIILTVCRLDPRKNLVTLLEAANLIINVRQQKLLKFLIIGDGVEREFLSKKIEMYKLESYVKLIGHVSDENLPKYYAVADIYVLPTLYETFGWVYIESMASGTPVLTTNVGSAPEVVAGAGILIEPKKSELLADTIMKMVSDDELLKKLTYKGLKRAQNFDWEKVIKKYERYYKEVSMNKCYGVVCKFSALCYIIYDFFLIIKVLFKGVILNKKPTNESTWIGAGQVGYNEKSITS